MALTFEQRNDKEKDFRLGSDKIWNSGTPNQDLKRALQKRAGTSPGTPERAVADKQVAIAEAVAGY
jgi:hypothetical protein